MKKSIMILVLLFSPIMSFAQTCPAPKNVFVTRGNDYIAVLPQGWQFAKWSTQHLDSDDVQFVLAAYGADLHPPTDQDNHVRCYYGNPDLTPDHGVAIETIAVIPETALRGRQAWYQSEHYYMCGRTGDVNECNFG